MNTHTDEIRLVLWPWGRDVANSVDAIRYAENATDLATMAEHVILKQVDACAQILEAFAWRSHELPIGHHRQLASLHPQCHALGEAFCSRPDVSPEQLDEWAEDGRFAIALAHNPNTSQVTIDRLIREFTPGSHAFAELMPRASIWLLEQFALNYDWAMLDRHVGHFSSTPVLLRSLAGNTDPLVRSVVADNPCTPMATINDMALRDENTHVLSRVADRLRSKQVLDRLAKRLCNLKCPMLAHAILKNPHSSEAAKAVAVMLETTPHRAS